MLSPIKSQSLRFCSRFHPLSPTQGFQSSMYRHPKYISFSLYEVIPISTQISPSHPHLLLHVLIPSRLWSILRAQYLEEFVSSHCLYSFSSIPSLTNSICLLFLPLANIFLPGSPWLTFTLPYAGHTLICSSTCSTLQLLTWTTEVGSGDCYLCSETSFNAKALTLSTSFPSTLERVTGRKARGLQIEEIACKCQTFLSLLSGRRKQTSNIFSFSIQI